MKTFDRLLEESTSAISEGFFQLPQAGGEAVYRERVYAYELYHQLRVRWPLESSIVLNGEVDKNAHPILKEMGLGRTIPDLLTHRPGAMDDNFAVVEIKCSARRKGLRSDLKKLSAFVSEAGYKRAIILVFGVRDPSKFKDRLNEIADRITLCAPVEYWFHSAPATKAVRYAIIKARRG